MKRNRRTGREGGSMLRELAVRTGAALVARALWDALRMVAGGHL
ncbi:hypothetical protein [Streptomyces longispororuber]|nr:hypothetical protein [Streptomyces longispororuber]